MILTPAQIAYYAQTAGFDGDDLSVAVAIALAESSGNTNVYNPETGAPGGTPAGQGSYGLWQIYLKDHPEYDADNLYDPQTNANDAYEIYSARGFSQWTTYNSGAYRAYLVPGASAAPIPPPLTPGEIAAGGYSMAQANNFSPTELLMIAALGLLGLFAVGMLGD